MYEIYFAIAYEQNTLGLHCFVCVCVCVCVCKPQTVCIGMIPQTKFSHFLETEVAQS